MHGPAILIIFVPVGIGVFVVFDKLVRLEYTAHKLSWEADGKPHGFFWAPPESRTVGGLSVSFGSAVAFNHLFFSWLFRTPPWVREDSRALRLLRWFRLFVFTWNVGILAVVFFLGF